MINVLFMIVLHFFKLPPPPEIFSERSPMSVAERPLRYDFGRFVFQYFDFVI